MGHPSERENAPEPHAEEPGAPGGEPVTPEGVSGEAASAREPGETAGTAPADDPQEDSPQADVRYEDEQDAAPYEPRVRLYEERVIGTVAGPTPSGGEATQAIPAVAVPAQAVAPAPGGADQGAVPPADPPAADAAGGGAGRRVPRGALWAGVGVAVAAVAYVGAQWAVADTVPKGTSVAGVDIGGLGAAEAASTLDEGLGPRAAEPVEVAAGEANSTIDPADAGLSFDAAATVDPLTGFSLNPVRLWEHLVGGPSADPAVDVDREALTSTLEGISETLTVAPQNGTVSFEGAKAVATEAKDGSRLVVDGSVDVLADSWLVSDGPYDLPTEAVAPQVTQAETDDALAEAEQVVDGPVEVSVGGQTADLPEEVLADATSFPVKKGAPVRTIDGEVLVGGVVDRTTDLITEPVDAHFEFSGGTPVVVGGSTGTSIEPDALAKSVGEAVTSDERAVDIDLTEVEPEHTEKALNDMGVKEVVSSFTTPLPNLPTRTKNLVRGAELVTGTLVAPGETFSLLDVLSPIEKSNGYYDAGVVSDGVHVDALGGGLSQMATTSYNAGYFAGFDDVEHRQHSYWFDRYPAGREATIAVGALDMKFKNDTPHGAVMESWVSGDELTVRIWSTKYYDVETSDSGRKDVVKTKAVHKSGPDCEPFPGGSDGFSITNYRKVYRGGDLVKDESYFWRYDPDNPVVCDDDGGGKGSSGSGGGGNDGGNGGGD